MIKYQVRFLRNDKVGANIVRFVINTFISPNSYAPHNTLTPIIPNPPINFRSFAKSFNFYPTACLSLMKSGISMIRK